MKIPEKVRRHPYIYSGTTAFVLAVAGIEGAAYANNPTYDRPQDSCASPFAISSTEVDRDTSTFWQTYMGINTTGVIASGTLPKGAYGVEASFAAPGENTQELGDNASRMLKADGAGKFALKMAIGSGEVQFGVRLVAQEGSELCDSAPNVTFAHADSADYGDANAKLPWPNPVNAVVELF